MGTKINKNNNSDTLEMGKRGCKNISTIRFYPRMFLQRQAKLAQIMNNQDTTI